MMGAGPLRYPRKGAGFSWYRGVDASAMLHYRLHWRTRSGRMLALSARFHTHDSRARIASELRRLRNNLRAIARAYGERA